MDRFREARRGSMAAVNGSLSRRRQRSSSLRDSPEEDGAMEMQETSRLRDRGTKKDRDRDRSGRNKRRRGDRMLHGGHREEGDDSSEESVDEDDDEEEEDSSVAVRLPPPPALIPTSSASGMQSHNIRKGYPVKPVRPPGTGTWKVVEEMIGAPIPRKARTSSVKRSQECWVSGGGGGSGCVGVEQIPRQASMSPARPSPSSTAPVSPSSSNASVRKKMKPLSVPKHRPPKTVKSSSIQEIEIEVAEVLFGMTRQVPPKQEDYKLDPKESNGSSNEVKSRVSSPNPISPLATSHPSPARPSNPSSNSFQLTATAPKRKRPRMRFDEESANSPPCSTILPSTSSSSAAKLDTEVVPTLTETKIDPSSPRSEKNGSPVLENGGVSCDPAVSNVSSLVLVDKVQQDSVKAENILDLKDLETRPEKRAKDALSPPKESPAANLVDGNIEDSLATKTAIISESQREDKFSIDLMAPPGKLSPEIESISDYVAECKSVDMEKAPKPEPFRAEVEKIEKKSIVLPEEIVLDDKDGGKPSTDDSDSRKLAGKERNLDLQLDLEKLDKDVASANKHQALKQQSNKAPRVELKNEKAGPTASIPMPMQITGWPGGFPPFGFMGQVPPLPPAVPVDGSSSSSKQTFHPSQLRPKRCAAHCYIAQNIHYHQQITRLNPFWPSAATGAAPLYASKQYNLNTAPASDSAILGSPLQGSLPVRSSGSAQDKGATPSAGHSSLPAKINTATQFMEVSQRKPPTLQQSSQPGSAGNMIAPAFIFPLNQQQVAAAAAANRSGAAKLSPGSTNTASSSCSAGYAAVGSSGANGTATTMTFNYPGLPTNEAQYLAFLQNNAYSFPIPAHVGGAPPYRGASPAQAMPFFNLSFYPSQMLHPPQLRLQPQSQLPPSSQQSPYSQQGHQNPSTSSGSSSSQKNTQPSQRVPTAVAAAITAGNSHGFPSSKQQQHLSHPVRQLESEPGGEDAPSTADSRASQAQKSIYSQKFSMPGHAQNFTLIAPAAAELRNAAGNPSEKLQQSHNQAMKVDLTPSQAFAMSFASFGGTAAGAAPHGLDFSSMAQNHALFQSLPEAARHGYQVSAAMAHSMQNKKPEDGKSAADLGNANAVSGEDGKILSVSKMALGSAQQHSLAYSRADVDSPISAILNNTVIDSSSRTLNLIQPPPPNSASRASNRPTSAAPTSNSCTNSQNSQHLLPQQQVLQLQKQHQQLQLQQQLQQQQRAKSASSHSNSSLYADRLPANSSASKFPQGLAGFPPALIQSGVSSQSAQWKASTRATAPTASTLAAPPPSASSSVKNQIPIQQQVRSQQPPAHQPHQISFGVSSAKVTTGGSTTSLSSAATTIAAGSPQNSVSKSSGGSPHSSSTMAKSVPLPSPVLPLPVLPFQKQQSVKNSSSNPTMSPLPTTNRSMPSILGNPHISSPQNLGLKPQPSPAIQKQHSPQAQLFFSYPYMQAQTPQSDAAAAAAGYFQQHQRRSSDQQLAQPRQNSAPASTGMLSLGPSSLSLAAVSGSVVPDPAKGAGSPAGNSKNLTPTSLLQHPPQFASVSQAGSGATHSLMYIHAMQSVPLKSDVSAAAEQKPASGR